jgi:hypothetical protein
VKSDRKEVLRRLSWWQAAQKLAMRKGEETDARVVAHIIRQLRKTARLLGATSIEIDWAMGKRYRKAPHAVTRRSA